MKRTAVFVLLFLFIFVLIGSAYLFSHECSAIINTSPPLILYPWEPTSGEKILPFNYDIPAAPGNNLSIRSCSGEYESASFIMTAQDNLKDIEIAASDLEDTHGNTISQNEIDVRLVKVWYQAGEDIWYSTPGSVLTPELLLKDDSLVKVDYPARINYLNVTENGRPQYIDITNPHGVFPVGAEIHDSKDLLPFSMKNSENKQVWMTIHIPNDTPAGDYRGAITIKTPPYLPVTMNIKVTVLPFALEPAPIEYSLYYMGMINSNPKGTIDSFTKTPRQYAIELQDMKDHGILYPTMYSWDESGLSENAGTELLIRAQSGLPNDRIYLFGTRTGNPTDDAGLAQLGETVRHLKNLTEQYGFRDMYVYGIDEADDDKLLSERPSWETVHQNGAKMFAAVSDNLNAVNIVGDILDVGVIAGPLSEDQAARWHSYGKRILSYGNPQAGVENPAIYRKNYGFALWNVGYDGAMDFAYQANFGNIWNDFDGENYRDHVFAYPTSDGVIDTVEWEGWREGVDDTRYVATLMKKSGNATLAKALVSQSLSNGEDMARIREKVIDQILLSYQVPVPSHS